ncbi:MAG: hypothetical protein SNJ65_12535, partial [Roseiflexus sp.]
SCTEYGVITADTLNQIKRSLVGASRDDAETILQQFAQQGLIGDYSLPAIQTLPGLDFLIDVRLASAS